MLIILEGPDGSGKTTLKEQILSRYAGKVIEVPRASSSVEGLNVDPMEYTTDLFESVLREELKPENRVLLVDRHPLWSDMIYGPLLRGHIHQSWPSQRGLQALRRQTANVSYVVRCDVPLSVLRDNLRASEQLPGVTTHIAVIKALYVVQEQLWPGDVQQYDYTQNQPLDFTELDRRVHINR